MQSPIAAPIVSPSVVPAPKAAAPAAGGNAMINPIPIAPPRNPIN
jgi:hypothetical protein